MPRAQLQTKSRAFSHLSLSYESAKGNEQHSTHLVDDDEISSLSESFKRNLNSEFAFERATTNPPWGKQA